MEEKKTAALHNLGCKVNEYETERMKRQLMDAGFEIVPFTERADVYVINTCTVTAVADQKSRQMIRRARRLNPEAIVCAAGCFVQTAAAKAGVQKILEDTGADVLVGNNEKTRLVALIREAMEKKAPEEGLIDINEPGLAFEEMGPLAHEEVGGERTRAFLKIQDGCDRFCSYCLIPYARGRSRSRETGEIIHEAEELAVAGFREIVVTGIHLGSFIGDRGGESLIDLLERLNAVDGIDRIRVGSLEPVTVTEEFAERAGALEKFCPQFHMSLQSGSDSVLSRMNRHYTTDAFLASVEALRKAFRNPAITTDIICGFPGETEAEFEETLAFVDRVRFFEIHAFPFSARQGTRAAKMKGALTRGEKAERVRTLIEKQKGYKRAYMESFVGKEVSLLPETTLVQGGKTYVTGYTREYIRAAEEGCMEKCGVTPGRPVTATVKGFLDDDTLLLS